ncbi:MAG TPA: hypothetical protein DEG71_11725 [Clostridiales bacterium]|nr:hypothetical protein [Clostridiales bacterium]
MKNRLIALLVFLLIILGLFSCKHNDKLKYVFRNSKNLVPIIIYHNFDRNANKKDTSTFDINKFERNLIYLKNNGYNTIFAKDLDKPLPEKPIVITMDDGYMSNYKLAFPLLKKYDMKATIFIIGWSVGAQNTHYSLSFFNWNQAKEMVDSKLIDIESHSYDLHSEKGYSYGEGKICEKGVGKLLNETDEDYIKRVKADYKKIYNLITEHLNYEPKVFAYPY